MARSGRAKHQRAYMRWVANLVEARRRRGLSQRDVADALGVDHSLIVHIERGERTNPVLLMQFAEVCGCSLVLFCPTECLPAISHMKSPPARSRKRAKPTANTANVAADQLYLKIEAVVSTRAPSHRQQSIASRSDVRV
jgi:transcriptional regulator with XRE-family HTH domain